MAKRRVALSPDLKKATSSLPTQEKDELLFRLLPKEFALVAQLEYALLEGDNEGVGIPWVRAWARTGLGSRPGLQCPHTA